MRATRATKLNHFAQNTSVSLLTYFLLHVLHHQPKTTRCSGSVSVGAFWETWKDRGGEKNNTQQSSDDVPLFTDLTVSAHICTCNTLLWLKQAHTSSPCQDSSSSVSPSTFRLSARTFFQSTKTSKALDQIYWSPSFWSISPFVSLACSTFQRAQHLWSCPPSTLCDVTRGSVLPLCEATLESWVFEFLLLLVSFGSCSKTPGPPWFLWLFTNTMRKILSSNDSSSPWIEVSVHRELLGPPLLFVPELF